jgi:selenocysteine-specific translation elongation factor
MESVNVAVLGGPGARTLAGEIAKKGSETDVTQYTLKKGERSLTLFAPAKYPEKIQGV